MMKKILVNGAKGKMGQESIQAISEDSGLELVYAADQEDSLEDLLATKSIDVVLDFTHPSCVYSNIQSCLAAKVAIVVGTTGLSVEELDLIHKKASEQKVACLVIPNFSIGAVLMMQFSATAAKYLPDYEIIEYHHPQKADAPSGTATKTAALMKENQNQANPKLDQLKSTELYEGARGACVDNCAIHSVRLPGFMADQQVVFGSAGQRLSIHHLSTERKCYMPGVILALKKAQSYSGLIYGLENLMDV